MDFTNLSTICSFYPSCLQDDSTSYLSGLAQLAVIEVIEYIFRACQTFHIHKYCMPNYFYYCLLLKILSANWLTKNILVFPCYIIFIASIAVCTPARMKLIHVLKYLIKAFI
ncbi:hypothetical protein D1007_18387 [Hordeum vulgare]|nr:hypothetical protein D1007_18387 [Hordeum vulgare]